MNLCETVPSTYHITVNRGYNGSLKKCNNVKLHYVKSEIFEIGRITIKSPQGQNISCYNAERCICDLLRDKDNQDIETYVNEMLNSDQQQNKTINKEEEEDEEQLRKYYKEITLDMDYFNQSIFTNKILQEYNEWS